MSMQGQPEPQTAQGQQFELARLRIEKSAQYVGRMISQITLIAGLISIFVVLSVIGIAISGVILDKEPKIPDVLSNWGGIILGFYFGQFVNLVKDFMGVISGTTGVQAPSPPPSEVRVSSPPPPR